MLIVYRTNPGFEGQIINLDKLSSPGEVDKWLASEAAKGRAESAYIEVNEAQMDQAVLAELATDKSRYRVRAGKLERDGKVVALGYDEAKTPASPTKAIRGLTEAASVAVKVDPIKVEP